MQSDRFRAAAESKDFSAIEELFTEDVVFRSPVVFKPYEGREAIAMLLGAVSQVFEDFRYTGHVETGDTAALAFSARVGDRELDGIDFLHFGSEGRINRMEVFGDDTLQSGVSRVETGFLVHDSLRTGD